MSAFDAISFIVNSLTNYIQPINVNSINIELSNTIYKIKALQDASKIIQPNVE